MTIEEICNKYIKVKATGILALHQRPKLDWAFKVVLGKESDGCNDCFLEKYYPLRLPYTCAAQQREDGKNVQFKEISKTMTREEAKELLPIIKAFAEGKDIQIRNITDDGWDDIKSDRVSFLAKAEAYRIKPESMYRPFKTKEECWEEMHKHPDFGWVKRINGGYKQIMSIHIDIFNKQCAGFAGQTGTACFEFEYIYIKYTFTDGTPFGIKEE